MSKKRTAEDLPESIAMPPLPEEPEAPAEDQTPEPETVEASTPEKQPEVVETIPVKQPSEIETAKEKNFKALREKAEKAERERDEFRRRWEESRSPEPIKVQQPVEDTDFSLREDDLAEGKHLNKLYKQMKSMQEELRSYKQQSTAMTEEQRIYQELPDYKKVVTDENIEVLKTAYPELADSLAANPNLYTKAKSVYTLIKKLGIHVDDIYHQDRAVVQKNAAKPKPLASVNPQQGDSPLSKANAFANGLTSELQDQLLKEMYAAMKSR